MRKRGHSPAVPNRNISATLTEVSGMAAASIAMPQSTTHAQPPKPRKKSEEEIKVVVDHYGDIVRSYGQKKQINPRVYLNADDLKAAADRQSKEDLREIERSMENLAHPEELTEESLEGLGLPTDSGSRRRSFVVEASSALYRSVKERVSAAFAGDDEEDDIIPPGEEPIPSTQRRGSAQINKRRVSKAPNKLEAAKAAKKGAPSKSESNWSNLRAPSPGPQGRKSSPSPMRRNSLVSPTAQVRKSSFGSTSQASVKPKMRETTTQTAGYDDSPGDPKKDVLLAARQELLTAKAEYKVRSTVDYITDLAMFIVACWLYLFQNELLAIPVLLVMVYRQLKEEIKKKLPGWMLGKKKAKRKS